MSIAYDNMTTCLPRTDHCDACAWNTALLLVHFLPILCARVCAVPSIAAGGGTEVSSLSISCGPGVPGGQDRLLCGLLYWGAQQAAEGRLHVLWAVSVSSTTTCCLYLSSSWGCPV